MGMSTSLKDPHSYINGSLKCTTKSVLYDYWQFFVAKSGKLNMKMQLNIDYVSKKEQIIQVVRFRLH